MLTISEADSEGDSLASRETSYNTLNEAKDKLQKTIRVKFDQVSASVLVFTGAFLRCVRVIGFGVMMASPLIPLLISLLSRSLFQLVEKVTLTAEAKLWTLFTLQRTDSLVYHSLGGSFWRRCFCREILQNISAT